LRLERLFPRLDKRLPAQFQVAPVDDVQTSLVKELLPMNHMRLLYTTVLCWYLGPKDAFVVTSFQMTPILPLGVGLAVGIGVCTMVTGPLGEGFPQAMGNSPEDRMKNPRAIFNKGCNPMGTSFINYKLISP
jgi:hypothetical protein